MSSLFDKLIVPVFGLAAVVNSGCYTEASLVEGPRTEPMIITEPGTYQVIPGDLVKGPLGVDLKVDEIDEYGAIKGTYKSLSGEKEFSETFFKDKIPIAFSRIRAFSESNGILNITENPHDLDKICVEMAPTDQLEYCRIVSPTEKTTENEFVSNSPNSKYYGKSNSNNPQQAECAANNTQSVIEYTSDFLGLPPLLTGTTSVYLFVKGTPDPAGSAFGNVALWYINEEDTEQVKFTTTECENNLQQKKFRKGDHEITHLYLVGLQHMFFPMFEEGLASFVPSVIEEETTYLWNKPKSYCTDQGIKKGNSLSHYVKYYEGNSILSSISGACLCAKIFHLNSDALKKIMLFLNENKENYEKNVSIEKRKETFEKALKFADINPNDFKEWGLGN